MMPSFKKSMHKVIGDERDACAIYAVVAKTAHTSDLKPVWHRAIHALEQMEHRAGQVNHRTDGTGLLGELPRSMWQRLLNESSVAIRANDERFWVLSLAMTVAESRESLEELEPLLRAHQFRPLLGHWDVIDGDEGLWSHALLYEGKDSLKAHRCEETIKAIEHAFPAQLASFSDSVGVLKIRNGAEALRKVVQAQWGEDYGGRTVIGHNRFSTNTHTDLRRVQPFLGLAHNGEINTIDRLMRDMSGLGLVPVQEGSDSQNLDRLIGGLCHRYGLEPAEAVRLVISPSPALLAQLPADVRASWERAQAFWSPVAQGPAAILYLSRGSVVAAVDALGLRPLWLLETGDAFVLSSEPGVVPSSRWVSEPRSIAPGEVIAIRWHAQGRAKVMPETAIERALLRHFGGEMKVPRWSFRAAEGVSERDGALPQWRLLADGWRSDDMQMVKAWEKEGHEPIGSLGFDGALGCLAPGIVNVADYLHETVAVVTNPALDREREREHFRLEVMLGARPDYHTIRTADTIRLSHPWLNDENIKVLQRYFEGRWTSISMSWPLGVGETDAAEILARQVVDAVRRGNSVILLDDSDGYVRERSVSMDPVIALGHVERALYDERLQRQASIVVRSSAIRHLHDAALLFGLGASALVPYAIWGLIRQDHYLGVIEVMNQGLEKIMSTMGTHELLGYGRAFSAIGIPEHLADTLGIMSYAAIDRSAWDHNRSLMQQARHAAILEEKTRIPYIGRSTTYIYKVARELAQGTVDSETYHKKLEDIQGDHPVQLRHILHLPTGRPHGIKADLRVRGYALPFIISSMSFGSQGETAFRAYAEAAKALNILAMNGEGGEIVDMIGNYYAWRGYQIASGRFGINARLINGAQYIEIKIGQGAKPGEGGHLPGRKVSEKVAHARRAQFGTDLISPSNNHDLYSIEDLRQLIDEIKAVHPEARIAVKVPIVPNIGTIAVGIVKAGADVVALSGYDGGTGAARLHALRHVGLPADVGVPVVHAALTQAGMRDAVEIWVDGGMRSADDVLKMVLFGADRVGFATLAMVALGCTICRQCQKDTCHVGITTQIESLDEAKERGLKHYHPQDLESAVNHLIRFFTAMGNHLAGRLGSLGFARLKDAIGRWDILEGQHENAKAFRVFLDGLLEIMQESRALMAVGEMLDTSDTVLHSAKDVHGSQLRTLGTGLSGTRVRSTVKNLSQETVQCANPVGQGFGAFLHSGVNLIVQGGAQDGVGKSASGGHLAIMKAQNYHGQYLGGHVGKSMAYGAQAGMLVVQGGADARAGIRMAGASLVIMGDGLVSPRDAKERWQSAAIKGFGFEYMTRGTALVLADPGPFIAAGMTGGTIYLLHHDRVGLTQSFLLSRIADTAQVDLMPLEPSDLGPVKRLLNVAIGSLRDSGQGDRVAEFLPLRDNPWQWFLKVVAVGEQADPSVSTE